MSDLKEQAKKIIAKGRTLGDADLIKMGLEMLEAYEDQPALVEEKKSNLIVLENTKQNTRFDINQFTMQKNSNSNTKVNKKQPISLQPRVNKFIDDGLEAKDIKTPSITPTERNRKSPMVDAVCTVCGKKEKVNEIFTTGREFYKCESCLIKGKANG